MRHPDSWIPLRTTLGINIVDLHRKVAHGLDKIQRTLHKASLSTSTANTSRRGCRTELGINHCWMWECWSALAFEDCLRRPSRSKNVTGQWPICPNVWGGFGMPSYRCSSPEFLLDAFCVEQPADARTDPVTGPAQ